MKNYYLLKLYGIPLVPVNPPDKSEISSYPLVVTGNATTGIVGPDENRQHDLFIADKKSIGDTVASYSDAIPMMTPTSESSPEKCTDYPDTVTDSTEISDEYKGKKKIHEANIPYLHAKLVKYGQIPMTQIAMTKSGGVPTNYSYPFPLEDTLITEKAIYTMETVENSKLLNDFDDKYKELCKGTKLSSVISSAGPATDNATVNCIRIFAHIRTAGSTDDTVTPLYAVTDFGSYNEMMFTASNRSSIVYTNTQTITGSSDFYRKLPESYPADNLTLVEKINTSISVNGYIKGHHLQIRAPLLENANSDNVFYLWQNFNNCYYSKLNYLASSAYFPIYTLNTKNMKFTPERKTVKRITDSTARFNYSNQIYYYSAQVLEYLDPKTGVSNLHCIKGNRIQITDLDPMAQDLGGHYLQIANNETGEQYTSIYSDMTVKYYTQTGNSNGGG